MWLKLTRVCVCVSPGYVKEDQPLYVGQGDVLRVHLELQFLVEAPGGADLLQAHLHVHAFVVEPEGGTGTTRLSVRPNGWTT